MALNSGGSRIVERGAPWLNEEVNGARKCA